LRLISALTFDHSGAGALTLLFLGQILAACGQPFLLNAPAKMATMWFTVEGRATADMFGTIGNIIGVGIASALSGTMANIPDSISTDIRASSFPFMLAIYAGIATFALLAAILLTVEYPPSPPSASASEKATPFRKGLTMIVGNRAYIVVLITFGIGLGIFNTITTILDQIVKQLGYGEGDASLFLGVLVGVGLVSAGITGPILDTYHKYKECYMFAFILATISFVWFTLIALIDSHPYGMIIPPLALLGVAAFIILPTALELSVELSYPVSASTSVGFLWMAGQVVGIISLFVSNALFDNPKNDVNDVTKKGALHVIYFNLALVLVGTILTFLLIPLNPVYKRLSAEHNRIQ